MLVSFPPAWASPVAQLVKNHLQCGRPGFNPWVGKIPWRRERLPMPVFWPGELHGLCSQSMGLQKVRHDWAAFTFTSVASDKNSHLPATSISIKSVATAAADLQHTLKAVPDGDQGWGARCLGKNWQNQPSESYKILGDFMSPNSSIFSYLEKH